MDKQRVVRILVDARELVRTKWVWGGEGVSPKSDCYCALGAIAKADGFPKMYGMDILRLAEPQDQRESLTLQVLPYQSSPELCAAAKLLWDMVPMQYKERGLHGHDSNSLGLVWGYNDSLGVRQRWPGYSGTAAPKEIIEWFDAAVAAAEGMA